MDWPSAIKTPPGRYGNWHKVYRLLPVLRVAQRSFRRRVDVRVFRGDNMSSATVSRLRVFQRRRTGPQQTLDRLVRLVNTLVNRQLHGLCLGGRHGGRQGLQVPGLGHCVAGFRNSGTENDLGELGQG